MVAMDSSNKWSDAFWLPYPSSVSERTQYRAVEGCGESADAKVLGDLDEKIVTRFELPSEQERRMYTRFEEELDEICRRHGLPTVSDVKIQMDIDQARAALEDGGSHNVGSGCYDETWIEEFGWIPKEWDPFLIFFYPWLVCIHLKTKGRRAMKKISKHWKDTAGKARVCPGEDGLPLIDDDKMNSRPSRSIKLDLSASNGNNEVAPTPIAVEPRSNYKAAIVTVALRLPTGGQPHTPNGASGLALGSALVHLSPAQEAFLRTSDEADARPKGSKLRRFFNWGRNGESSQ